MGPEEQHLSAEEVTETMAAFIRHNNAKMQLQTELFEIAKPFLTPGVEKDTRYLIGKAIESSKELFNGFIGELAARGYAIGVREENEQVLPVKKLSFNDKTNRYSLECAWQNETHAVVFDDTISFAMLKAHRRHAAPNPAQVA